MTGSSTLLAIVGPTASGKTEAGIAVAEAIGAEIVSIDSTTVYRRMDVHTAKPTAAQRARVPHHLIDVAEPEDAFSVAAFQRLALASIDDVRDRGRLPLLVGGSGLYYRAVVDRLVFPGTEPIVRSLLDAEIGALGPGRMHDRLADVDPDAAARMEPGNRRRIVRALEVAAITGRPFSSFAADWERYPPQHVRAAGIDVPREILYRRIEARATADFPGLLAETEHLVQRGAGPFLTSLQAIGYAEAMEVLDGSMSEQNALASIIRRVKALARRQLAWFRRDPRVRWFPTDERGAGAIAEELTDYLIGALTAAG